MTRVGDIANPCSDVATNPSGTQIYFSEIPVTQSEDVRCLWGIPISVNTVSWHDSNRVRPSLMFSAAVHNRLNARHAAAFNQLLLMWPPHFSSKADNARLSFARSPFQYAGKATVLECSLGFAFARNTALTLMSDV